MELLFKAIITIIITNIIIITIIIIIINKNLLRLT